MKCGGIGVHARCERQRMQGTQTVNDEHLVSTCVDTLSGRIAELAIGEPIAYFLRACEIDCDCRCIDTEERASYSIRSRLERPLDTSPVSCSGSIGRKFFSIAMLRLLRPNQSDMEE